MADSDNFFQMGKSMVQEDDSAFFTEAPDESRVVEQDAIGQGKSFIIKEAENFFSDDDGEEPDEEKQGPQADRFDQQRKPGQTIQFKQK